MSVKTGKNFHLKRWPPPTLGCLGQLKEGKVQVLRVLGTFFFNFFKKKKKGIEVQFIYHVVQLHCLNVEANEINSVSLLFYLAPLRMHLHFFSHWILMATFKSTNHCCPAGLPVLYLAVQHGWRYPCLLSTWNVACVTKKIPPKTKQKPILNLKFTFNSNFHLIATCS